MSNIYLKFAIKKNKPQNVDFLSLKSLSPVRFSGGPTHTDIIEF